MFRHVSVLIILFSLVMGCAPAGRGARIILPESPDPVVIDTGNLDKRKFPNTRWIKPPSVDSQRRTAAWSFEDIDKISQSLSEWAAWEKDVRELVEGSK